MKKLLAAVAAVAFGVAVAVAGNTPAFAASCASGSICFFDNTNGTGLLSSTVVSSIPRTQCRALTSTTNNKIGYIVNNSGEMFHVYDNSSCSGTSGPIYPWTEGAMNSTWNNKISSFFKQ